ncbi:MAG: TIGR03067 domain-containing protein [Verrucomicrobia bacterium]|nr:TIGR03067 domain-containing protein [Verrucomicrobiota bacterium]
MKNMFLLGCLLVALTSSSAAAEHSADLKKLLGTWEGAAVEGDGSRPGSSRARISELVITPEKITAKDGQGNSLGEGTFILGKDGATLTIDASGTGGQTRGKFYRGILSLTGDTLKWCSGNPGKERPKQFRSTPPDAFLIVLTRKK